MTMDDHNKFLTDRILSEEAPLTYRLLSRALDIHVNNAKKILHDFHYYQNSLHANSVHATYLVIGTKLDDKEPLDDGDAMMDSPPLGAEALSEHAPVHTVTLVAEGDLKDALARYQEITSIHIYSLAPYPQRDLTLLVDESQSVFDYRKMEDAVEAAKIYGVITNPSARRKNRTLFNTSSNAFATQPISKILASTLPEPIEPIDAKEEAAIAPPNSATPPSGAGKKSPPTLKRGISANIMQSFAKAAAQPPKLKSTPMTEQDESIHMSDDGEADNSDIFADKKAVAHAEASKKSRKEREKELQRMMDNFEEGEGQDNQIIEHEVKDDSEPELEPELDSGSQEKREIEPVEVVSGSGDGRRRGKRRVLKKKRILDDKGYMVTIQEAAWESFSEDEAQTSTTKPAPASSTSTPTSTPNSSTQKSKKNVLKGSSQGSIMSFFSRK